MIRNGDGIGVRKLCIRTRNGAEAGLRVAVSRSRSRLRWPLFAIGLLAACSRGSKPTAPGCCEKSGPGWTDDAGADSAAPAPTASTKPAARFRAEEGCARDFKTAGDPSRDLGELERLCGQGLAPLLGPNETTRAVTNEPTVVSFRVTGSTACLRAGAVGVAPGQVVSLENANGKALASAVSTESIVVVPVDGTVCVRENGGYRFVVKSAPPDAEARTLTVQVWQASRD